MTAAKAEIFIYGASGHARVVIDIIEKQNLYRIQCIADDDPLLTGCNFCGYPVLGGKNEIVTDCAFPHKAVVAIGNNEARDSVGKWLKQHHILLTTAVHPSVQIGRDVHIGAGSVLMANAAVNPAAHIGDNCIVNTGATIDHDCRLEDGVHIAPGCTLCGNVHVGKKSFIGAGAVVIHNITIGENVFVAAGTTVYEDLPDFSRVVGPRNLIVYGL